MADVTAGRAAAGSLTMDVTAETTAAGELRTDETTATGSVTAETIAAGELNTDAMLTDEVMAATGERTDDTAAALVTGLRMELTGARSPPAEVVVVATLVVVVTTDATDEVVTGSAEVVVELVVELVVRMGSSPRCDSISICIKPPSSFEACAVRSCLPCQRHSHLDSRSDAKQRRRKMQARTSRVPVKYLDPSWQLLLMLIKAAQTD
jgi:hypothetical protein